MFVAVGTVSACSNSSAHLRIRNLSDTTLNGVVVLFPKDQVHFGDVGAKSITEYREVQNGVGEYASFEFAVDGKVTRQLVADFVRWRPLTGKEFTYEVKMTTRTKQPFLEVTSIIKDR